MFWINDATEDHAFETRDCVFGDESSIPLPSGGAIKFPAYSDKHPGVEYVRVVDDEDRELMYWNRDEFKEDFDSVMGAVLGLARTVALYEK